VKNNDNFIINIKEESYISFTRLQTKKKD